MIFNELFNEYLSIYKDIHTEKEYINKMNRYKNHIEYFIGNLEIKEIKFKDCQKIVNCILKEKELSPKTAKNVIAVVKAVFNYALKNDYIDKNPTLGVLIPQFDNKYNINLSDKEIKKLIQEILNYEDEKYRLIFLFALHGRRKNEILQLQAYQINLNSGSYFIPAQKNKSKKYLEFEMTPLLKRETEKYIKSNFSNFKETDYLFLNKNTNTHIKDIKKPFQKLKDLAAIANFRFHDFRHLLGTQSVKLGVPIEHISQTLGHSSIEVTQRYITRDISLPRAVCSQFLKEYAQLEERGELI